MSKNIEPREIEFNAKRNAGTWSLDWIKQLETWADVHGIDALKITVKEIIQWDITLMRGFLHAKIIPAFKIKIADAYPARKDKKAYTAKFIKNFLKHRFLGYQQNPEYVKWGKTLRLDDPGDIMAYVALQEIMVGIKQPPSLISTEKLEPVEYWRFLNDCEAYYFELFHEMYNLQTKPKFFD